MFLSSITAKTITWLDVYMSNTAGLIRSRNCLLFASTWVCLVGFVLLIFLVFCVVLLCVFMFRVPCCDVRYDFRIKTMFGTSLPPVVCRRAHDLFTLFVCACAYWCPTHIVLVLFGSFCGFFLVFSSSCVPCVASFSGLSICGCSFGIL